MFQEAQRSAHILVCDRGYIYTSLVVVCWESVCVCVLFTRGSGSFVSCQTEMLGQRSRAAQRGWSCCPGEMDSVWCSAQVGGSDGGWQGGEREGKSARVGRERERESVILKRLNSWWKQVDHQLGMSWENMTSTDGSCENKLLYLMGRWEGRREMLLKLIWSCVQRQINASLSHTLRNLNWVSGLQREWNIDNLW